MTTTGELHEERNELTAMIGELQTTRTMLHELVDCYRVFRFTGGVVPEKPIALAAMDDYLQSPFAPDRISTASIELYRRLAETIMQSDRTITTEARPRSLRTRIDISDIFFRESSEIVALGVTLESSMTILAEERKASPLRSETESAGSGSSTNGIFATT